MLECLKLFNILLRIFGIVDACRFGMYFIIVYRILGQSKHSLCVCVCAVAQAITSTCMHVWCGAVRCVVLCFGASVKLKLK